MRKLLFLCLLSFPWIAYADMTVEIPLTIQLPTENVDGTALTDLDSVQIYYGFQSGNYSGELNLTPVSAAPQPGETIQWNLSLSVPNNTTVYVTSKATDNEGNQSAFGNEVFRGPFVQSDLAPKAPTIQAGAGVVTSCPPGWRCEVVQ